jgi:uncharacterized membrane protein YecN with MAPEG domain
MHAVNLPVVTTLTAGILIFIQMVLMLTVVVARRRNRQSLSDGGKPALLQAIRRHGNFAENAAIFIAGFALLELMGGDRTGIEIMSAIFVVGRISHGVGLSLQSTVNIYRIAGIALTALVGFALAVRLVSIALANF